MGGSSSKRGKAESKGKSEGLVGHIGVQPVDADNGDGDRGGDGLGDGVEIVNFGPAGSSSSDEDGDAADGGASQEKEVNREEVAAMEERGGDCKKATLRERNRAKKAAAKAKEEAKKAAIEEKARLRAARKRKKLQARQARAQAAEEEAARARAAAKAAEAAARKRKADEKEAARLRRLAVLERADAQRQRYLRDCVIDGKWVWALPPPPPLFTIDGKQLGVIGGDSEEEEGNEQVDLDAGPAEDASDEEQEATVEKTAAPPADAASTSAATSAPAGPNFGAHAPDPFRNAPRNTPARRAAALLAQGPWSATYAVADAFSTTHTRAVKWVDFGTVRALGDSDDLGNLGVGAVRAEVTRFSRLQVRCCAIRFDACRAMPRDAARCCAMLCASTLPRRSFAHLAA